MGSVYLPTDPAPGFGGLLLAGIVGAFAPAIEEEVFDGLNVLMDALEHGRGVAQPRLRHRFQTDTIGLDRSRHKLVGEGEHLSIEIDDHSAALPQTLGAVYAAGLLSLRARPSVFRLMRRATRWQGDADDALIAYLTGEGPQRVGPRVPDEGWALAVLGFSVGDEPARSEIQQRFRRLVRHAHPDHGGAVAHAGQRIVDLTVAKRILLSG